LAPSSVRSSAHSGLRWTVRAQWSGNESFQDFTTSVISMDVWQGVAMDPLRYDMGPPCLILLRPAGGPPLKRPEGRFLPFWTPHSLHLWSFQDFAKTSDALRHTSGHPSPGLSTEPGVTVPERLQTLRCLQILVLVILFGPQMKRLRTCVAGRGHDGAALESRRQARISWGFRHRRMACGVQKSRRRSQTARPVGGPPLKRL
jgi:hypothetical protein